VISGGRVPGTLLTRVRLPFMSVRPPARRNAAMTAPAVVAVVMAGLLAAGCSQAPAAAPRPSVDSCTLFGIHALEHHVTVTKLPAACRGLTPGQVNFAIGRALYAVSSSIVRGKAARRAQAAKLSPLLAHLVTTVPAGHSQPVVVAPPPHRASRFPLGLATLATWLIAIGLGSWMMARWIAHGGLHRALATPGSRPWLNFTHFGLAVTGLLAWIAFLVTGLAALAWAACVLLLPVAGLGMALLSLWLPERARTAAPAAAAQPVPVGAAAAAAAAPADAPPARHQPVLTVAAHATFAVVTILLALLTAVGVS
jgi:hypothetical protein